MWAATQCMEDNTTTNFNVTDSPCDQTNVAALPGGEAVTLTVPSSCANLQTVASATVGGTNFTGTCSGNYTSNITCTLKP